MTREEAIKELKNIKENIFWGDEYGVCFRDEWVEAYEMAISALREQSQWISVKERLPGVPLGWNENPEPVFFIVKGQDKVEAGYYGENGMWRDKYFRTYRDGHNGYDADDVLCWMWQSELPEPPKEDTP